MALLGMGFRHRPDPAGQDVDLVWSLMAGVSRVTGFRETAAAIRRMGVFPKNAIPPAARKALKPMLAQAKSNLRANQSFKRGVLFRSMRVRKLKSSSSLSQWVVAATGKGVSISHLVEFGTAPHWQPKRGVMHPGARPKPFLTPAFDQRSDEAVRIFGNEVLTGLVNFTNQVAYRGR